MTVRSVETTGTIHGDLLAAAGRWGRRPFQRADGGRVAVNFEDFRGSVLGVAGGLAALGMRPGDRVALVAENEPRWLAADVGVLAAGGIVVPRGAGASTREVAAIVRHSGCRFAFVQDAATYARHADALRESGVEGVALLGGSAAGALRWEDLQSRGRGGGLPDVSPDAVATIVYTSGTTGEPKGVTLRHRNVTANVHALHDVLPVAAGHVFLALLPTWHMYERTVEYYAALRGAVLAYTDLRRLRDDLVAERPHVVVAVPRVWQKVHDAALLRIEGLAPPVRAAARAALRASLAFTRSRLALAGRLAETVDAGLGARLAWTGGLLLAPLHVAASVLVHRRIRAATGGRLVAAVSGGALLPPHVDLMLAAAGMPLLVGYGLTETSPVVAVRRLGRNVIGTIGTPLARTEVRVAAEQGADGAPTLRVRGPQVMAGYWRDDEATRRVLDADGWFDTGDVIRMTGRGDLAFCGRAKDTIVLIGGENVEPEPLEQAIAACPWIEQAVVLGQDQKALGALVWPAKGSPLEGDLAATAREVRSRTGAAAGFHPWETIHRVRLLPGPLTVEDGTLTATLKVRRRTVLERHSDLVRDLFHGG